MCYSTPRKTLTRTVGGVCYSTPIKTLIKEHAGILVRQLLVRQTPLAASRTRALSTDWTSSVSFSLQTGAQHAEESKDEENHILGIL